MLHNPVLGVKRPRSMNRDGVTPALGNHQARLLLEAPPADTLKGKRDRAILATLLYHAIRREELCALKVVDIQQREGVPHLCVERKGDRVRYLPAAPATLRLIAVYLEVSGHAGDLHGPLFRPVKNNATKTLAKPLSSTAVSQDIVKGYARETGIADVVHGVCVHSLVPQPPPMPWPMRPTSPRFKNGWGLRIFRRCGCMISASPGPRTARRSRSDIEPSAAECR